MSNIPADLYYTAEHEWITAPDGDGVVRVGITDFAQDALGDVVYAQLPEAGSSYSASEAIGEVESTKSVSDIFAPLQGEIVRVNDALDADPGLINSDPYGGGWLMEMRPSDADAVQGLLSADDYSQQVG
ncbi:glycine cleavage system protein GcvH [Arthrobacter castelli]|uniref:glycine cleavage system protein GcvH n=1 Tax=Arthrobacter castelli TaxID=271431 RepID=UPI00040BE9A4|nr:glycine cleavage system protein GcvH [Arthrobacter castelli]